MCEGYLHNDTDYLAGGKRHFDELMQVIPAHDPQRVLDYGSCTGRVLRHFQPLLNKGWTASGTDMNPAYIMWGRKNLRVFKWFYKIQLPQITGQFDFLYALSVFSHIAEPTFFDLPIIAELLREGGHAFLTIHDEISYENVKKGNSPIFYDFIKSDVNVNSWDLGYKSVIHKNFGKDCKVFFRRKHFISLCHKYNLHACKIKEYAHGCQTGILFQKISRKIH